MTIGGGREKGTRIVTKTDYSRRRRARLAARGLCTECGRESHARGVRCLSCAILNAARAKRSNDRRERAYMRRDVRVERMMELAERLA